MDTTVTYIDRHDSLRPVGPQATQSLLDEKKIPALREQEYEQWADYLYLAAESLRLAVAETLFSQQREHLKALALFLACVYPIAKRSVYRVMTVYGICGNDLTQELMFDGAINEAINFFRAPQREGTIFQVALYYRLRTGAFTSNFRRAENTRVTYHASVDRHSAPPFPRTVEQLFSKEMLDKIAALETEPRSISKFLRALVNLGPEYVLLPSSRTKNRVRTHAVDYQEVCDKLGITYFTAIRYFVMARKILRQTYNSDGSLFMKTVAKAIQD